MSEIEVREITKKIPIGAMLQIIKKNGSVIDVMLMSHEISGVESKDYGDLVVPALPPALIVRGGMRFGNFRLEISEISNLVRIA